MFLSRNEAMLIAFAIIAVCAGCSRSAAVPLPTPCEVDEPLMARAVYPGSNATSVPDNASVVIYSLTFGTRPLPVALAIGTASPVALAPTAVPSPLPSPAYPTAGEPEFAAALPLLRPATSYTVYVGEPAVKVGGCLTGGYQTIDNFMTL